MNETKKADQVVEEKADKELLLKYVDYELKLEAKNLRLQSNPSIQIDMSDLKMDKSSFEKMTDNFLVNERNIMRQSNFGERNINKPATNISASLNPQHCYDEIGNEVPCYGLGGGQTVSCTGNFTGMNTTNTVLFVGNLNNNNSSIVSNGFAFGGFSGTWAPAGSIDQTTSQNEITYKQYYTDSYKVAGVTYTQIYLLYGNI